MRINVLLCCLLCVLGSGCKKEYGKIYDPPPGQAEEIFKQLSEDPSLSTFATAVDKVPGLKDELSSSGLFTVLAPNNDAFDQFFAGNPKYKSLDDIPVNELSDMVKYHIMKWMLFQDNFVNPGITKISYDIFKYESRAVTAYYDQVAKRSIFYPAKMLQVYTPEFFQYYGVSDQDYTEVFGGSVNKESGMNVMGASVIQKDVASGNGVIHILNQVLVPPNNIAQELDNNPDHADYNSFLKRRFLTFTYNQGATIAQGNNGDVTGDGIVDSLWTRTYTTDPLLDNENGAAADKKQLSLTALLPTKEAFKEYLDTKLRANFYNIDDSIPVHTLQLLYKSHLINTMDWPSKVFIGGSKNELGDKITVSREDVASIQMASNGLIYNTKKVIEPLAFTTVGGPAFFKPQYWYFAEALVVTGLVNQLVSESGRYTVFAPKNEAFLERGIYYTEFPSNPGAKPGFYSVNQTGQEVAVASSTLAAILGNGILLNTQFNAATVTGSSIPQFYPTLNGSFAVFENGRLHGSEADTVIKIIEPDIRQSNGYFHGIDRLVYPAQRSIFDMVNSASAYNSTDEILTNPQYTKFKELCAKAGLLSKDFGGTMTQVDAGKKLTLFIPSNEVITAAQVAGLLPKTGALVQGQTVPPQTSADSLRLVNYLSNFFISDAQAFTDGKVTGSFLTRRQTPNSTPTNLQFLSLTVAYQGNTLVITTHKGTSAMVIPSNPVAYPQNRIARDGVIQIIDNALTSLY